MSETFTSKAEIVINAPIPKVWDALINPDMIKQYLYGTEAISDWKEGSPIVYRGEWEGKHYEDKGEITKIIPEKLLATTYWSSMSGLPDAPENYQEVVYELSPIGDATNLTITMSGTKSQESADHSASNWKSVMDKLKELLEK